MKVWDYIGVRDHTFSYDEHTGWFMCTCGMLSSRVNWDQAIPTAERHIRAKTNYIGKLMRSDIRPSL